LRNKKCYLALDGVYGVYVIHFIFEPCTFCFGQAYSERTIASALVDCIHPEIFFNVGAALNFRKHSYYSDQLYYSSPLRSLPSRAFIKGPTGYEEYTAYDIPPGLDAVHLSVSLLGIGSKSATLTAPLNIMQAVFGSPPGAPNIGGIG
jgi:hypothetical protein